MTEYLADYSWVWWIIIGFIAGMIARALMPGRGPSGCIMTVLLGIGGAVVAGFLGQKLDIYEPGEGAGFIAAIIGAIIILFAYRLIARR